MKNKWLVFIGAALAVMMVDIDMTAVNLAIDQMTQDLGLSIGGGQWIINGYSMAAAVLMAFAGRLGDSLGHKRVFLGGVLVFSFASLAVALSVGFWSITIARIIQGACIAFTFPVASVFVREVFPENQKGLAVSLIISVAGISQALGPTFGGSVITLLSWHWIFIINIPLSVLSFVLIYLFLDERTTSQKLDMHFGSLMALIIGLFSIMTALNEVNQFGVLSIEFMGLMALGVVSTTYFIVHEMKLESPLLNLRILLNRPFGTLISTRLFINFVYFSWLFGLGLLLQKALGYSVFHAGLIMLCMTLTIAAFATPMGKWIDKAGYKPALICGLILMIVSCLMLALTSELAKWPYLFLSLFVAGTSASMLIPATATGSFQMVKPEQAGVAMGVLFTSGFLGNSFGVAISGSILEEHTIISGFSYAMVLCALLSASCFILCLFLPKSVKEAVARSRD